MFIEPNVISSKGKSGALISYKDNILVPEGLICPSIELASKLIKSEHVNAFSSDNQEKLKKDLGYYSNLQSIRSEDSITWSLFGYLAYQNIERRNAFFNELLEKIHLDHDANCHIKLWTRLPHPDKFCSGGPEMDVILIGEKYLILVECKWTSKIGQNQGVNRDTNQIEIRHNWIDNLGTKFYPNHHIKVLFVANENITKTNELFISWDSFCNFKSLPHKELFTSYLNWKKKYLIRKKS